MKHAVLNLCHDSNARRSRVRGVGLLEVLVTLLVMGIGMFAISKLHTKLIQYSVTSNNRALAVTLAQAKLEELRHFRLVKATDDEACSSTVPCFDGIGSEDEDIFVKSPDDPDAKGLKFRRLVVWEADTGDFNFLNAEGERINDLFLYKQVEVRVSWVDINGSDEVVLRGIIYPADNAAAGVTGAPGTGANIPGPRVKYTPVGLPDAVPIEIGDSKYREASKPVPDVSQDRQNTVVKFNNTSYSTPDNTILSNEEFVTVSCVCEFNNVNKGMAPTRQVWNATSKKLEFELGYKNKDKELVSKPTGQVSASGQKTIQDELCNVCCRDHHDATEGDYPKYSPQQDSFPHKHYYPNASDVLQEVTSGEYLESCRMQRINGLYYVLPDWLLRDLVVVPKDDYFSVPATLAKYQTYIQQGIAYWALGEGSAPEKNSLADRNYLQLAAGQQAQLLGRGIYVDTIYKCRPGLPLLDSGNVCPTGTDPNQVDDTYITDVKAIKAAADNMNDWRRHVSVSEVNLTVLGTWATSDATRVTVDNQPVQDILDPVTGYYTSYYRGRVTGSSGTGATAGSASITATARTGNTGLTSGVMSSAGNVDGYGRYPNDDTSLKFDFISVTRLDSLTTYGVSGNLELVFTTQAQKPKPSSWGATALPSAGVSCTSTGNANAPGYSCTVPSGWAGTITPFAAGGGGGNDPAGTTYFFKPSSQTHPAVTAAKPNQNFKLCKVQSLCQ